MKLTTFSDYALRVLIFAAIEPEDGLTVSRVADAYGISLNHLMKVVQFLGQAGWLDTARGRGGGFTLARPAGEIRLGDVIRATEGDQRFIECVDKNGGKCCILPACTLPAAIHAAQEAFYRVLNQYTLADVAQKRNRLARLLEQT
ncbi:Rrf2 family transcriptional regulator [Paraburkholderia sp. Tr-20389]|uniref:Rrf2 family transcriptional regulator n=1 Tax=Paraburkholderia sp. Tr-20389 TaxID=2703903 RepID=UPI00197E6DC7|nr:Rrf2 family transcriptional regulator [Paraburkholderia sp. Tr-20389]